MPQLHKKNKRLSRYEQISARNAKIKALTQGKGLFVYRNRSKDATLRLPKPAKDGRVEIGPNGEWEGDDYFDMLVKNNQAILVRTVEDKVQKVEEKKGEPVMLVENKLILDQPETVTVKGAVEHVVVDEAETTKKKKSKKNESAEKGDVLLTDGGLEGIQILG